MGSSASNLRALRDANSQSLTPANEAYFNRIATRMDLFHDSFREMWNLLHGACVKNQRPRSMSVRSFINLGVRFCQSLEGHHRFEEAAIFPVLARKIPMFREREHLLAQHEKIHEGLKSLENYLLACEIGEKGLKLSEMKNIMDSFGTVLWEHLDEEVEQLGAKNMRKYYTLEEFQNLSI